MCCGQCIADLWNSTIRGLNNKERVIFLLVGLLVIAANLYNCIFVWVRVSNAPSVRQFTVVRRPHFPEFEIIVGNSNIPGLDLTIECMLFGNTTAPESAPYPIPCNRE